jgi:hypothetical protein
MTRHDYSELFGYEENDRDRKALKKDYRALKNFHGKIKFKNLLDFYLTSSSSFEDSLKLISGQKIIHSLQTRKVSNSSEGELDSDDGEEFGV